MIGLLFESLKKYKKFYIIIVLQIFLSAILILTLLCKLESISEKKKLTSIWSSTLRAIRTIIKLKNHKIRVIIFPISAGVICILSTLRLYSHCARLIVRVHHRRFLYIQGRLAAEYVLLIKKPLRGPRRRSFVI